MIFESGCEMRRPSARRRGAFILAQWLPHAYFQMLSEMMPRYLLAYFRAIAQDRLPPYCA